MTSKFVPNYLEQRTLQQIFLVGSTGYESSVIFIQGKILYKDVLFLEDKHTNIKLTIKINVYVYLGILLEGRGRFEEDSLDEMRNMICSKDTGSSDDGDGKLICFIGLRLKSFSDWLLKTIVSGNLEAIFPVASCEYASLAEELWRHKTIRATSKRKSKLELLPSTASYYLERAVLILRMVYEPSGLDVLYAESVTSSNGLVCVDFSFLWSSPNENIDTTDQYDSFFRYQLIIVQARSLGGNCKWLEMFEDVGMVVVCVALSDCDQFSADGTNKMLLSWKFLEGIVTHPTFDLFEETLYSSLLGCVDEEVKQLTARIQDTETEIVETTTGTGSVDAVIVATFGLSVLLVTGVVTWKECLAEAVAWATLTWVAANIAMVEYLKKYGFTSWFSETVVKVVGGLDLSWQLAIGILVSLYFYSHYFFSSRAAHIGVMFTAFLSMAYAAAKFVGLPLRALHGDGDVYECSFVQFELTDLPFFASRIKVGRKGIEALIPAVISMLSSLRTRMF